MIKDEYNIIGLMSGTSLDGVDLVYARFELRPKWSFQIIYSETIPYSIQWVDKLSDLVNFTSDELKEVDVEYTHYLSQIINTFISKHNIKVIDAICSHGHTALHKPEENLTLQIGNLPIISKLVGQTVVCDFRVADVTLGGQGAPLVPIGDKLLFPEFDFCLNLGGFANISMDIQEERIAYDICPANIVLNWYIKKLGLDFDDKGQLASSGKVNIELLNSLNDLAFYSEKWPKSLGLEWVNAEVVPIIDAFQMEIKDILSTFCEHIAFQVSKEINQKTDAQVLVTGGGVYNSYVLERLKFYSKNKIVVPDSEIIEFKEALIFAFLGVLKLRNEVNCLKSVTGASRNHSSGKIYTP
ncbi:anhydro-N-acetylmuramic acid kinase [Algibacter sp. 2305UL17-15]|uniref:anhydro-N-acetylmuramic acid kinase n=1 Tax=Algibacter sp. 2305UL17-15 TaxID=3231268 RepID=UPI003458FDF6